MPIFCVRNLIFASLIVCTANVIAVAQLPSELETERSVGSSQGYGPALNSTRIQACDQFSITPRVNVEYGERRPVVDGVGNLFGIPRKLLLWDRRAHNHAVSETTICEVTDYLEHRHLSDTIVRVNQYAPGREWQRLVNNRKISPGWRYTVGSLKWLKYTIVPGRLFGKDEYNPYTNSLYLYSDMPVLGLAEAAYANDVSNRVRPGTYAAVQDLPLVALWHETLATDEVLNYVSIKGSSEQVQDVRHDLYARYGLETAGAIGQVLPDGTGLFPIVGAVSGHAVAAIEGHSSGQNAFLSFLKL